MADKLECTCYMCRLFRNVNLSIQDMAMPQIFHMTLDKVITEIQYPHS